MFLGTLTAQSNEQEYQFLVDKVCEKISSAAAAQIPFNNLMTKIHVLSKEVGTENEDAFEKLFATIKKNNPTYSEKAVLKEYLTQFVFLAIKSCPQYLEYTLSFLGECPKENELFTMLKNEADAFINENSTMELFKLNNATIKHIVSTVMKHKDLAKPYYEKGIEDAQFFKDMNSFLYHQSQKFLELTILIQIEKMTQ